MRSSHLLRKLKAKAKKVRRHLRRILRRKEKAKHRLERARAIGPYGEVIIDEAVGEGLPLHIAVALCEWESGIRNVFGCDLGPRSSPPYCHQSVTRERVTALLRHIRSGGASNGVGLTQLTYPQYLYDAEEEGGAHAPRAQCRVGFEVFASYLRRYGNTTSAYAHYNGGVNPPAVSWSRGREFSALCAKWRTRV